MRRLGYERYAVQGTDVGSGVAGVLAMVDAERVVGMHLTGTVAAMPFGPSVELDGLSEADKVRGERFNAVPGRGLGYLHIQATRPQTLAYSLNDSPVGQLAWIVEKFKEWTDPAAELPEDAVDRDQLLTNVSIYWFTGAGASSAPCHLRGHAGLSRDGRMAIGGNRCPGGDAVGATARRRRVRRRHHHPSPVRPRQHDRALVGVRARRSLPGHGSARICWLRIYDVLPPLPVSLRDVCLSERRQTHEHEIVQDTDTGNSA